MRHEGRDVHACERDEADRPLQSRRQGGAISGTAGVDPATGDFAGPDAYSQARQILRSFRSMLEDVGSDLDHVLHVHVFLRNTSDFEEMKRAYREGLSP